MNFSNGDLTVRNVFLIHPDLEYRTDRRKEEKEIQEDSPLSFWALACLAANTVGLRLALFETHVT